MVVGLFSGALEAEDLGDYVDCTVKMAEEVADEIEDAATELKKKTPAGVAEGLEDIGDIFETIGKSIEKCTSQ